LLRFALRIANEDALATGRAADPGSVERTRDAEPADARRAVHAAHRVEAVQRAITLGQTAREKCDAHAMRAGGHFGANILEAIGDLFQRRLEQLVGGAHIRLTAEIRLEHPYIVDGEDDCVWMIQRGDITAAAAEAVDIELIDAIGREE